MQDLAIKFMRWCPGALGLFLRQRFYGRLLGNCGRGVIIGRFVDLINPELMSLGNHAIISNHVVLDAAKRKSKDAAPGIVIDDHVFIGVASRLIAKENRIEIQYGSNLGSSCSVVTGKPVLIGKHVLLAAYCRVGEIPGNQLSGAGVKDAVNAKKEKITHHPLEQTVVEQGAWLGVRVELRSGVHVGEGAVVGAHSVVENAVPAKTIVAGRPARILRERTAG